MSQARYTVPMPPEPILLRNSNCRSCIGIMMACPHFLHGSVASGGRSPGMNTFASHPGHVTMRNGVSLMLEFNLPLPARRTSLEKE